MNIEQKIRQAISLRASGDAEQARECWLSLLEEEPGNAEIWYQTAWTHDALGLEREAVPYYEEAIRLGLGEESLAGALLGLGSTLRTLGEYGRASEVLEQGLRTFPERREFRVFYAMVLYNLGRHAQAMELLLAEIADTSGDDGIRGYAKAIRFYADKLDEVWE
ncbi:MULTISPECIES: tetratricopeptide repeat protein [Paenibacillus]|uniref:Tetratrico peptide repeat group 5 domain-containing protein n=1 Tax=Paenibacillus albilobatus TaxID=2716884 RepID=A0A919XEX7_9BACL|nr:MULTISPECIES: tetratricopeptide repeat protein [Paenibacillus]GIO29730.1 hypothetical protein J2TS6_08710 [Paenibacillus albilobatus]